ncbi:hypothetical protein [Maribacter sp. IgM3_T14_3]|uniref:hypothetical protein n=1 Tax=Maribacter sp. IgM3_T14_3 TaxID=3415140 RepID=UPI003C702697
MTFLSLILLIGCKGQEKREGFKWNSEKEKIHNQNRNDSTKLSVKTWNADIENIRLNDRPMVNGVFPVPDYDFADSTFVGLGNSGDWKGIKLKDKTIIHHSLFVTKSAVNQKYIPNKPNEVYFTILGLTDSVDTKKFTHTNVNATSRNHPHYSGQGFIKTKSNTIDFTAFLTADRKEYAIVNMRLFDLKIGRIILIAPQKDGTFRSLQLESPIMSSEEMDVYVKDLLNDKKVMDFFTRAGNI